jgi:hypothetical protein
MERWLVMSRNRWRSQSSNLSHVEAQLVEAAIDVGHRQRAVASDRQLYGGLSRGDGGVAERCGHYRPDPEGNAHIKAHWNLVS